MKMMIPHCLFLNLSSTPVIMKMIDAFGDLSSYSINWGKSELLSVEDNTA